MVVADSAGYAPGLTRRLVPLGYDIEDSPVWCLARAPDHPARRQGWKLHLSASVTDADALLSAAVDVLADTRAMFKVATSRAFLRKLNDGYGGLSQVGKFMTIYPRDDDEAVALAEQLDAATDGMRGPWVPTDRPLRSGSRVHYRYGTFDAGQVSGADGAVLSLLDSPDGPQPDQRLPFYLPPTFATDPFLAAGVAEPLPVASDVVDRRFVIVDTLFRSPRGAIQLAVDVAERRQVLLKRAHRWAAIAEDGRDAVDRLHAEATILRTLAGHRGFPWVGEWLSDGEDALLVMEDVEGEDLASELARRRVVASPVQPTEALRSVAEIGDLLGLMHDHGWLHRDCKPGNLIRRDDGQLVLLDHEMSGPPGPIDTGGTRGTLGYVAPETADRLPGDPSVDVYALGVVLHEMLTLHWAWTAPEPADLAATPVTAMIGLPAEVVEVRERLLGPAAQRPPDGHAAAKLLRDTAALLPTTPPALVEPVSLEQPCAQTLAEELLEALLATATTEGDRLVWRDPSLGGQVIPATLYDGVAGIVLALATAIRSGRGCGGAAESALATGARTLVDADVEISPDARGALYTGELGIALALDHAGEAIDDAGLRRAAAVMAQRAAAQPLDNPDVLSGAAGRLLGHLLLYQRRQDVSDLAAARAACDHLLATVDRSRHRARHGDRVAWPLPRQLGSLSEGTFRGYAHGTAGMAHALLVGAAPLDRPQAAEVAAEALEGLLEVAVDALPDGSGLTWPEPDLNLPAQDPRWCHGAPGVAVAMAAGAGAGIPGCEEATRRALATTRAATFQGIGRCHGLAGSIGVLLDVGQPEDRQVARHHGWLLARFATEGSDGPAVRVSGRPAGPGLMRGIAGMLLAVMRLADPDLRDPLHTATGRRP